MKNIENSECLICFGNFIKEGRERLNLFQSDVAERVGISQPYYSKIENGERNVDLVLAMKLCKELKLDLQKYIHKFL